MRPSVDLVQVSHLAHKVAVVTLNSPSNLNALSRELVDQLCSVLRRLDDDEEGVAAVVITGCSPPRSFSSGFFIAELEALPPSDAVKKLNTLVTTVEGLSVPVIAAVAGIAFGGGCELALACDMIYSTVDARFALPEVKLGLIPAGGGLRHLSMVVGRARAASLILTGREWTGVEAERWGMVTECFDNWEQCLAGALQCAETIAGNDSDAVRTAKKMMRNFGTTAAFDAICMEQKEFGKLLGSEKHVQLRAAWLNRKKTNRSGGDSS